ncbi:MAG: T9SS type A sorting domain-containing protein [Parabacteroides sp.]|nr:T9SS type A sorting domain-containing protein [Parabacteroides sp.]
MKKFFTQTILLVIALLAGTSAKAFSYKIDGPDKLETNAVYSIVTTDGSALPSGLTATWNYPSDFYRISYTSTTIKLGRKTAEGYYTLSAQLSDGTYVSKSIEAVKPTPVDPVNHPVTQNELTLKVVGISDKASGFFSDINQYTSAGGKTFTSTTGDLFFSCVIAKTSSATTSTIETKNLKVAFGYREYPYTTSVYQNGTLKENITLYKTESTEIVIQAPYPWTTEASLGTTTSFYFVYTQNSGQQLFNGTYRVKNGSSKSRAIEKKSSIAVSYYDASNITVKSTDDSAIKSIRFIGTMGDLVKSQSYGNNCTETNFDLSNCKNGIYYIQVEKTNGVETAKIIKK